MSYRRVYVNTAEAVRTLDVAPEVKSLVADAIVTKLTEGQGAPEFDADRFKAHATSETDEKWAYNKDNDAYVPEQTDAEQAEDAEEYEDAEA